MNDIVFASEDFAHIRREITEKNPREVAFIALAGYAASTRRLLVREIIDVPDEAYWTQGELSITISPTFIASILKRARDGGWSFLLAHSHPASEWPEFSSLDDMGEQRLMPSIAARAPNRPHATIVFGRRGFSARIYDQGDRLDVPALRIVRSHLRTISRERRIDEENSKGKFSRSVLALGPEGQQLIREVRVGIVGLGGTGSIVAQQLAYLGVKEFILIDDDVVELSNLNRLVGATLNDVGQPKVSVASRAIQKSEPSAYVEPLVGSTLSKKHGTSLLSCDIIFCCTDTQASRALLNQIAYQYMIPVIDVGTQINARGETISSISGRVQMLSPGLPCLTCQNALDAEAVRREFLTTQQRANDRYIVNAIEPIAAPSVISLNGVVSSLAVTMFLSAVSGLAIRARHQIYNAHEGTVRRIGSERDPNCKICSRSGVLGAGDRYGLPWKSDGS